MVFKARVLKMAEDKEPKEMLEELADRFQEKVEEDDKLEDKLEGFERTINVKFKDDGNFHFELNETDMGEIKEGSFDDADIVVTTDSETLGAIQSGEMKGMEAYAKKKIKVDAPFLDLLKIKELF